MEKVSSGRTQVLYKAHVLYCAFIFMVMLFFLWILLKSAFCAVFFEKCALFL